MQKLRVVWGRVLFFTWATTSPCKYFKLFRRVVLLWLSLKTFANVTRLVFNQSSSFKRIFIILATCTFAITWTQNVTLKAFTVFLKTSRLLAWAAFNMMLLYQVFWFLLICVWCTYWCLNNSVYLLLLSLLSSYFRSKGTRISF